VSRSIRILSLLLIVLGVVVIGRTVWLGVGGGVGLILGGLMVAAGVLRLWMAGGGAWPRG